VVLALSLALCGPAAAQFGPLPPAPEPVPAPQPAPSSTEDDGLSTAQQLLLFGAGIALIGVIAWVIMRDAKRSAPVAERPAEGDERKPSTRERERQQRQRRDKAKAARQQRKRNRSR